jgi:hypothetical protein
MATLVLLTVHYAADKTRTELINIDQVVRIIDSPKGTGSALYFGVSGPEIVVAESISEIQQQLSALR